MKDEAARREAVRMRNKALSDATRLAEGPCRNNGTMGPSTCPNRPEWRFEWGHSFWLCDEHYADI